MSDSKITPPDSKPIENSPTKSNRSFSLIIMAGVIAVGGAVYTRHKILTRPPSQEAIISKSKTGMAVVGELESLQLKFKPILTM